MNIPEKEGRYLFCFDVDEEEYYYTVDEVMINWGRTVSKKYLWF